ncbi:MAG TPA: hypothetical protein VFQ30_00650, partial [Ktedonobacteraceae bacterium]|nr:hypothetical protein [Ktedonobacteraceae bacterium]
MFAAARTNPAPSSPLVICKGGAPRQQGREDDANEPTVDQPPTEPGPAFMHQLTHQGNFLSPDEWPVTGLPDEERDDIVQVAGDALSQPADQCCQAERGKNCWLLPSEENRGNPAWHHQAERDDCRYAVILCHIQHLTVATTKHAPEVIGKEPGGC